MRMKTCLRTILLAICIIIMSNFSWHVTAMEMSEVSQGDIAEGDALVLGTGDGTGEILELSQDYLLYDESGELLVSVSSWAEIVAKINSYNQKQAVYHIAFPTDCEITGNLKMPSKGKYQELILDASLTVTGSVSLSGNLTVGEGSILTAKSVSGAAYQLTVATGAQVITQGVLIVGDLELKDAATIQAGGKLTVKKNLVAEDFVTILLNASKGAEIKNTTLLGDEAIQLRYLEDTIGSKSYDQKAVVIKVTGNSYAPQFALLNDGGEVLPLYRTGTTLRIQGDLSTPFAVWDLTEEQNLGNYVSLADVKAEVGRRKKSADSYRIYVEEAQVIKGALSLPAKNAYQQLILEGEKIEATGALSLTGYLVVANESLSVKSISGGSKTEIKVEQDSQVSVIGNFSAYQLDLAGKLSVGGSFTVTDIVVYQGNCLIYDISKSTSIKGVIKGDQAKLVIAPKQKGNDVSDFPNGIKLLSNVPKADMDALALYQETTHVFYRDGKAVKLSMPLIVLFEGTTDYETCQVTKKDADFVTINDLIAYVNKSEETEFVARLNLLVPSVGNMTPLTPGKHLVLCGKNGEKMTLTFTGNIELDGSYLEVHNLILDNKTAAGPTVNLKNNGKVFWDNSSVNSIAARDTSEVVLRRDVRVNGAVSGTGKLTVLQGTTVRSNGNIAINQMILQGENAAEFRLQTGKKLLISGEVMTGQDNYFMVNIVDKKDALANIGAATVLVSGKYAEVSQFKTENPMNKSFLEWSLVKKGDNIQTNGASAGDGEWSGDYL